MVDALSLFKSIIAMPEFERTAIILFLNKNDLLEEKIMDPDSQLRDISEVCACPSSTSIQNFFVDGC